MADVVSSQRFLRDDFVALAEVETGAPDSDVSDAAAVLMSVAVVAVVAVVEAEVAEPAPADTADDTLFVRDSEAPTVDKVLLERE